MNKTIQNPLSIGNLTIDFLSMQVFIKNKEIYLTNVEYRLFIYLFLNAPKVISRDELAINALREGKSFNTHNIHQGISRLKDKLGQDSKIIKSVYGKGYKLSISGV